MRWAAAGGLPAGFDRADRFAVLPIGEGRSFLLSLADRRGASSALTSYNSLRSGRTRLARRVLAFGLRAGLAQPLLRTRSTSVSHRAWRRRRRRICSVSTYGGCSAMTGS